jgi:hypothetical protein
MIFIILTILFRPFQKQLENGLGSNKVAKGTSVMCNKIIDNNWILWQFDSSSSGAIVTMKIVLTYFYFQWSKWSANMFAQFYPAINEIYTVTSKRTNLHSNWNTKTSSARRNYTKWQRIYWNNIEIKTYFNDPANE